MALPLSRSPSLISSLFLSPSLPSQKCVILITETTKACQHMHTQKTWVTLQARSGTLTQAERDIILCTAKTKKAVSTGVPHLDSRLVGLWYLEIGKAVETVHGIDWIMNVSDGPHGQFHQHYALQEAGIKEEVKQLAESLNDTDLLDALLYIFDGIPSSREYDKKREHANLSYFMMCPEAQEAKLKLAEVAALRLYTTSAYIHINGPLRDLERWSRSEQCPLPATTRFAAEGAKKLRALNTKTMKNTVLWRGMRNLKVKAEFLANGGTDRAFMSATKKLDLAVRYSLSLLSRDQTVLLFKILVHSFESSGAELAWLSAFPHEDEVLFPPLTYMRPTGREDRMQVDHEGLQIDITVIEVEVPHVG